MATAKRTVPLRRRLLLVAAGILPLAIMAGAGLLTLSLQQREQAERGALEGARALSAAVDAQMRQAISVLEVLATSPTLDGPDIGPFHDRLQRAVAAIRWPGQHEHVGTPASGSLPFPRGAAPGQTPRPEGATA